MMRTSSVITEVSERYRRTTINYSTTRRPLLLYSEKVFLSKEFSSLAIERRFRRITRFPREVCTLGKKSEVLLAVFFERILAHFFDWLVLTVRSFSLNEHLLIISIEVRGLSGEDVRTRWVGGIPPFVPTRSPL